MARVPGEGAELGVGVVASARSHQRIGDTTCGIRQMLPIVNQSGSMETTVATQRRWNLLACAIMLAGVVLGSVLAYGRFGAQWSGGNPMTDSTIMVDHVHVATNKTFDEVTKAFEAELGKFDGDVRKAATACEDIEEAKAKIPAMAGPSDFILFGMSDHGALLRLAGQHRKAIQ